MYWMVKTQTIQQMNADGDGTSDRDELDNGTDPTNSDSDEDGLTDTEEVDQGTDPNSSDSDEDGIF